MLWNILWEAWFTRIILTAYSFWNIGSAWKDGEEKRRIIKSNWTIGMGLLGFHRGIIVVVRESGFNVQPQLERINSFESLRVGSSVNVVTSENNKSRRLSSAFPLRSRSSWGRYFSLNDYPNHTNEKITNSSLRWRDISLCVERGSLLFIINAAADKKSRYKVDLN